MPICQISGKQFETSEIEKYLQKLLNVPEVNKLPQYIFRELSAFWPHFAIHKRKCAGSGKTIFSVYDDNCPYPVYDHSYWTSNTNPPSADFDFNKPFFTQLFELFKKCPIPHNCGLNNVNSDYTDDCWESKNCYLCHSLFQCEDSSYCFRVYQLKDSQFITFSNYCELCLDICNSINMYRVIYAVNSQKCEDSAFLFDCRNVSNSFMCWNLRNKKYCMFNQQLTEEQYKIERAKYDLSSRRIYSELKEYFKKVVFEKAIFNANLIDQSENCTGNYLDHCKNAKHCFLANYIEDTANILRGFQTTLTLNCVSPAFHGEKLYYSAVVQDHCYEVKYSHNLTNCRFMEYCQHCLNSENCFACSGLINQKFCILNKQYEPEKYREIVEKIKQKLISDGVSGSFFPGYFAGNPYVESLAFLHWPLSREEQEKIGARIKQSDEVKLDSYLSPDQIPDKIDDTNQEITTNIYWDEKERRPFRITDSDLNFYKENKLPLPDSFYLRRLRENYSWISFDGTLRETTCPKTNKKILTTLPSSLDGKIFSEEAYLEQIL